MAKNNKLLLYRTSVKGSTTEKIEHGELALNYNSNSPFVMFKDSDDTIQKVGAMKSTSGTSEYHSMTQKAITEQVTMPSDYNVTYPTVEGINLINTLSNSHTITAISNIDSNLSKIAQKIIENNESSDENTSKLTESLGLNDDLSYKQDNTLNYIGTATSLSNADSLLDDAITTVSGNVDTLSENLESEVSRIQTILGQTGTAYDPNDSYRYISGATSLNDADIRLNNAITAETKNRQDAINALDATVSGNGTHVDVTVVQTNGKVSSVSVAESDIASAAALSTETTNRTNTDNKIIASVGLNSDGTFTAPTTAQTSGYTTAATSIKDAIIIMDNQIEENETVTAYALTDLNNGLSETNTNLSSVTNRVTTIESNYSYYTGHTTATVLTAVPTTKRLCIATISSSQTLNVSGTINDGKEIHIIIKNSSTSDITITIPSTIGSKTVVNMVGENLIILGSSYGEINLTSDGTYIYYRGA